MKTTALRKTANILFSALLATSLVPSAALTAFADETVELVPIEEEDTSVPSASDISHVHNMPGWECTDHQDLICENEEHRHSDECWSRADDPLCGTEEGDGGHSHTAECYAGAPAPGHDDDGGSEDESGETDDPILICEEEESEGHAHTDECFLELSCGIDEHEHSDSCYNFYTTCDTEFTLLTVEYFIAVDGQRVRAAESDQLLLPEGEHYSVKIPDLSEKGYRYVSSAGLIRLPDASTDSHMESTIVEKDDSLFLEGEIIADTKVTIDYGYINGNAPYQGNYYGQSASGSDEELIYSFIGQGVKDTKVALPTDVSEMISTLYAALDSDEMREAEVQDGEFAPKLVDYISEKYGATYEDEDTGEKILVHDITPFLSDIAGGSKIGELSRVQIKQRVADIIGHAYGLDSNRSDPDDNKVQVTADSQAEKNFYYKAGEPQSAMFVTGFSSAEVTGIPQEKLPAKTDSDGVSIPYEITLGKNFITSVAGADISGYTRNISATSENFDFIGWHKDSSFGVIDDYTADNSNGKYRDLQIYSPTELAAELTEMPSSSVNYYAVWNSKASDYIVQLWFESPDEEDTYIESHSYDMKRTSPIGREVTVNDFDRNRADESIVADAANGKTEFPVQFVDGEQGGSGESDVYYTWSAFESSPFYGFDLLDCSSGEEGHACPKKLIDKNGNASRTEGNACNHESVVVGENGETVLNVFYTREMWEVKIHPAVEVYQYNAPTDSFANVGINYEILASGGRLLSDLVSDAKDNDDTGVIKLVGKYGTPIPEEYLDGGEELTKLFGGDAVNVNEENTDASGKGPAFPQSYIVPAGQEIRFTTWVNHNSALGQEEWNKKSFEYDITLNYNGLTSLSPELFSISVRDNTAGGDNLIMSTGTKTGYTTFGSTSNYNLSAGDYKTIQYGSRSLDLYPSYLNTDDSGSELMTYNIDYFVQPLPSDSNEGKKVHTYSGANGTPVEFVKYGVENDSDHTVSFQKRSIKSKYTVDVPEGFTALMWRTSATPITGQDTGAYGFTGLAKIVNAYEKNATQMPPHTTSCTFGSNDCKQSTIVVGNKYNVLDGATKMNGYAFERHNSGFGNESMAHIGDSNMYLSDWKIWYIWHPDSCSSKTKNNSTAVAYYDPTRYWIGDWVRTSTGTASMDGSIESYNELVEAANSGDKDSIELLDQLRSTVVIGDIFPVNVPLRNPYAAAWDVMVFANGTAQPNAVTSVAFARSTYNITYNSCYINGDGDLVRDTNGNIVHDVIHTTSDDEKSVYYDQPLGVDPTSGDSLYEDYSNYYNAKFKIDDDGEFVFTGYASTDPSDQGGYGKWFLDPDGTIEFNEENLATMPAGNVDVYYHYKGMHNDVYFVDDLSGGIDYKNVDINGTKMDIDNVVNHQMVVPNGRAERFDDPVNSDNYFVGWFYDREGTRPFNFNTEITEDTILYAVWQPKDPTEYTIKHILIGIDGEKTVLEETTEKGYVGNTIDASALGSSYYHDGMYFEPDYYSSTMVLEPDADSNLMEFYYRYTGRSYTVEYRDIDSGTEIAASDHVNTTLNIVTSKYKEIFPWQLVSEPYVTSVLNPTGDTVITFWYKMPAIDIPVLSDPTDAAVELNAAKYLDGEAPAGTRFTFDLCDTDGNIIQTTQAVDGAISFRPLAFTEPGTYSYTLSERNEEEAGIIYDTSVYNIEVVAEEDTEGNLLTSVSITRNGERYDRAPIFANETEGVTVIKEEPPAVPAADKPSENTDTDKKDDPFGTKVKKPGRENTEVVKHQLSQTGDDSPITGLVLLSLAGGIMAIYVRKASNATERKSESTGEKK